MKTRAKLLKRAISHAYLKTESEYFDRLFKASPDYIKYIDIADHLQKSTTKEIIDYLEGEK